MPYKTPRSISKFCRTVLPLLHGRTDGKRVLKVIDEIVDTDRWNSFDRFHDTTKTLVRRYEEAGAKAEVYAIQTGGAIGSGRWIVQEAEDVRGATVDVVRPVRQRILDYRENPWHVIQWTSGTPREGMTNELVVVDTEEELQKVCPGGLRGKMVLTKLDPRSRLKQLTDRGAAGVITDHPVAKLPEATAWTKFGWGGIPIENAAAQLVGLVLSERAGEKLRGLVRKHGRLTLHTKVDVRRYVGTHDLVSGIIRGGDDPQDEVWVLAHSAEPGAIDNASGVAVCLEIARVIEGLIAEGALPRPKRTIRLLNGYECYSFFHYLEHTRRLQTPLAGVCLDTLGAKPEFCDGQLSWRATIPMSAGFVDRVGEAFLRATLRLGRPVYRLILGPFMSTSDTLIGDPKFGFPCPWLTTHFKKQGVYDAYHTSADTLRLLSPDGLARCATAMAAYLYYLADAGSSEVMDLAGTETDGALEQVRGLRRRPAQAAYVRDQHRVSIERLQRWMWGGDRGTILSHLSDCERRVREATPKDGRVKGRVAPDANRVPRRLVPVAPSTENMPSGISERIQAAKLSSWALFWADGDRTLAQIAEAVSCEQGKEAALEQVSTFFEAHADLGYVELVEPKDMTSRAQLIADLKALGLGRGMDVMVHSSMSKIGHVIGGAETVAEALLGVIGKEGTLVMPSFNHRGAEVFNPLATPTTNGAIPDAFWRRPDAVRSLHPTHPVAAVGPKAEAFCRDHLEIGIWERESPIGRVIHGGGYLLLLGVDHNASTAYHVAEAAIPCGCTDPFGNVDRVVGPDGEVREVRGLAFRGALCPVPPSRLNETLDRRRLQRHGKVGRADATLVKAFDLYHVRREHLKDVCPTCTIQPRIRE
ncbi:MAG: hypothetical protein EXS64_18760 [Candidatus Latescibacteria bacterium]|nr:hypothetical protein [Candidatus Latescibacterota bacterium]